MYPKMTVAGFVLALACGLIVFARYSLDALFAGGLSSLAEADILGENFALLVIGCAALIGAGITARSSARGRAMKTKSFYRVAF